MLLRLFSEKECFLHNILQHIDRFNTIKLLIVATSIKQTTCIKQAWIQLPNNAITLNFTCIMQAPVLSEHFLIIPLVLA